MNLCLKTMYRKRNAYTTTELYEKIYGSLIQVIMRFVRSMKEEEIEKMEALSETFIDNLLGINLVLKEGKWVLKEGVRF